MLTYTAIVQFDKTFLTGNLAGLTIPGQTCTYPEKKQAQRHATFLEKVIREGDFLRDAATGHKFTPSNVHLFDI